MITNIVNWLFRLTISPSCNLSSKIKLLYILYSILKALGDELLSAIVNIKFIALYKHRVLEL